MFSDLRLYSAAVFAALSLAICFGSVRTADAEDAPDAKKDIQSCLAETGDFVTAGKSNHYVIGIENKCPQRLQCVIDAYITGAKGPVSVHTSMTLEAKSKKSYAAKVKTSGGTAQVSRNCKVL